MKTITVVLLAALACLVGLRIINQSRRNHVDFVTFSSDEECSRENPVALSGIDAVLDCGVSENPEEDFKRMVRDLEYTDTSGDAMAVLFDERTKLAIISLAVMSQLQAGNRAVMRKVKRYLMRAGAENVIVSHICAREQQD